MSDNFHEPVSMHIGNQTRSFMLTPAAYRRATRALKQEPKFALTGLNFDAVCIVLACALHHDKEKNGAVSDDRVEKWLTAEPKKFPQAAEVASECVMRFMRVTGQYDDEDPPPPGGEGAPPSSP
jgi:hypothetical protein